MADHKHSHRPLFFRAVLGASLGVLLALALLALDANEAVRGLLGRVEALGWAGPPLFVLLHGVAVVLLVPGILFPLGAGLVFGFLPGTLYSVLGKALGATAAFLIARHLVDVDLLPERAREFRRSHPKLRLLEEKLPEGGWRIVLLIRLVPIIPFKLSNYVFGWSGFTYRHFLLGTLVAAIPFSLINAYLGSLAANLASLEPRGEPRSLLEWAAVALGAVLSIGAAVTIGRTASRILRQNQAD